MCDLAWSDPPASRLALESSHAVDQSIRSWLDTSVVQKDAQQGTVVREGRGCNHLAMIEPRSESSPRQRKAQRQSLRTLRRVHPEHEMAPLHCGRLAVASLARILWPNSM